jgi:hypothetical protein
MSHVPSLHSRARPILAQRAQSESPSWFDRIGQAFRGEDESAITPELAGVAAFLTAAEGFSFRMTLGSEPAKSAGGSGTLAKAASPTVSLELPVRFAIDSTPAYDPFQGDVILLKDSKFFATPPSFWLAEYEKPDDRVPVLWQMRVSCKGIDASGQQLLPAGQIFFNARLEKDRRGEWALTDGTITVKETVPFSRGILAELKLVGVFDVTRIKAAAGE